MKYSNSVKYMNSFKPAESVSDVSLKRLRDLCTSLGRVNIGTSYICIPSGAAGYALSVMLESVFKSAGYNVGRITATGDFESRSTVFVNGAVPQIDDYNKCVAELKSVVQKNPDDTYCREEVTFALSLLICKLCACDYVILEGLSNEHGSIDSICAPYDLVIIPTVYDSSATDRQIKVLCDMIRRGAREVVSGNQRSSVYSLISNACLTTGARLNITAKPSFEPIEVSSRRISFSYADRAGYSMRGPSYIQRDCAMTVIESALAIRRDGIKMTWASIASGISTAGDTLCFDTVSVSPLILVDSATCADEAELTLTALNEIFGHCRASVCIPVDAIGLLTVFSEIDVSNVIIVGDGDVSDTEIPNIPCKDTRDAAKEILKSARDGSNVICLGSVKLAMSLRAELLRLMNG